MEFIIISGLSGAGKSSAAAFLEDLGFYCVDNMPTALLTKFAELCLATRGRYEKVALVTDIRSQESFTELFAALDELADMGVDYRILFVEASESAIVRRYKESRRPHPLQHGNRLIDGILEERHLLEDLKERADWVIDTSSLSIHQLSTKLYEAMLGSGPTTVAVHIFSFGFKYGMPIDADFVADVLGEHAFGYFLDNKHQEWEEYNQQVTPYELKKYLPKL